MGADVLINFQLASLLDHFNLVLREIAELQRHQAAVKGQSADSIACKLIASDAAASVTSGLA